MFLSLFPSDKPATLSLRLSWTSLTAGTFAMLLFLLPLSLSARSGTSPTAAYIIAWFASFCFSLAALYSGYLAQLKDRGHNRKTFVLAIFGGALGLATLILLGLLVMGLIAISLAG